MRTQWRRAAPSACRASSSPAAARTARKPSAATPFPYARGASCARQQQHALASGGPSRAVAAGALAEPPSEARSAAAPDAPVIIISGEVSHSLTQERLEVVESMNPFMEEEVMHMLKPIDKCWQPQDLLPDPAAEDFIPRVEELRARTAELPDDYLVVLVGDMVTEEALPTYMSMLNTLDGIRDETGSAATPWAKWTRAWTAEENRHGDLLNKYLYLSGRVDMRAIEVTIQKLIGSGMCPKTENNPYLGYIYTSFQERATKISHGNTGLMAKKYGDEHLNKVCALIAGDEARHEAAYAKIAQEIFNRDPDGMMLAFADMMRKQIVMPAHLMDDDVHTTRGSGRKLFEDFEIVAMKTKTYTTNDYISIMEYLIGRWDIPNVKCVSPAAQEAQDYVCALPKRLTRLAQRTEKKLLKRAEEPVQFSWIFDRTLMV